MDSDVTAPVGAEIDARAQRSAKWLGERLDIVFGERQEQMRLTRTSWRTLVLDAAYRVRAAYALRAVWTSIGADDRLTALDRHLSVLAVSDSSRAARFGYQRTADDVEQTTALDTWVPSTVPGLILRHEVHDRDDVGRPTRGYWYVTHGPSGLNVQAGSFVTYAAAQHCAALLGGVADWTMPAADFVERLDREREQLPAGRTLFGQIFDAGVAAHEHDIDDHSDDHMEY